MSKKALGRGIDALLSTESESADSVTAIPVANVSTGSHQPRRSFSEQSLEELAHSIRNKGVLQPILVEPAGDQRYTIVAGERRLRAARIAGLSEIPALIRSFSELEKTEIALIENLQREDLSPVEEANGYRTLIDLGNLTQEQVAQRVGKNRATVANSLRLLKLPEEILQALDRGRVSAGHARALLAVQDEAALNSLFRRVLEREMSVREVEQEAARIQDQRGRAGRERRLDGQKRSPELRSLEQRLIERLGTKVSVRGSNSRGKIEVSYYSMEDLERILLLIAGPE